VREILKFDSIYSQINKNLTKLPGLYKILGIYFDKKHDKMVEEITRRLFSALQNFLMKKMKPKRSGN
jgi:hypothetical protein